MDLRDGLFSRNLMFYVENFDGGCTALDNSK